MLPGRVNEDAVIVGSTGGVVFVCLPLVVSTPEPDLHRLNDGGVPDHRRASRGAVLGDVAALVLVGLAVLPGGEPTVARPGSSVVLGCLEGRNESATDAAGQTTDAASEATDRPQDVAARGRTRLPTPPERRVPLARFALEPGLRGSSGVPPRALPRTTLRRSPT